MGHLSPIIEILHFESISNNAPNSLLRAIFSFSGSLVSQYHHFQLTLILLLLLACTLSLYFLSPLFFASIQLVA